MSSRFASTSILRSALAAHAGLSATSLLRSTFGPSEPPPSLTIPDDRHRRHRPPPHRRLGDDDDDDDAARVRAALPWLDRLHVVVADLYAKGGGEGTDYRRRPSAGRRSTTTTDDNDENDDYVAAVRLAQDVSFDDPIVRHAGASEVERAFRGRLRARPWGGDVETVLEFVEVEASDDGICGGGRLGGGGGGRAHRHPLLDISPSPPRVVVTYRLSQRYGIHFALNSLLLVTVQVKSRGCSEKVRRIEGNGKVGTVPIATSALAPRSAGSVIAAAAATYSGVMTSALLARAANGMVVAAMTTTCGGARHPDDDGGLVRRRSTPLVAEVVGIEERWNGVGLLDYVPFRWSRRLNGLVVGSVTSGE